EFGSYAGFATFCLTLLGGWVTVFSSNLYWMPFTLFFPTVTAAWTGYFFIRSASQWKKNVIASFFIFVFFLLILIKSLMGYEYLSAVCISATVPIFFYLMMARQNKVKILLIFTAMGLTACAAFATSLHMHYERLSNEFGSKIASDVIKSIVLKNTHSLSGNADLIPGHRVESLNANTFVVILFYIFSPINKEGFFIPPILILAPSMCLAINIFRSSGNCKKKALAITSAYSILAPLSWLLLAKAHSAHHFHLNFILWYLPTFYIMVSLVAFHYQTSKSKSRI
ncbi:MAG: hypothetical protein RLZZ245_1191, partial [Verrucomicrobiota bacterium]